MTKQENEKKEVLRTTPSSECSQNKCMARENDRSDVRYVFHLQSHRCVDKMDQDTTTSASVYSTYKQRIDSMFDDSRSQSSFYDSREGSYKYKTCLLISERHLKILPEEENKRCINNVQAKIEKMFTEMAKTQRRKQDREELRNTAVLHENSLTQNSFAVEHLGYVRLLKKVSSLQELQVPLKDLYFDYCRKVESRHGNRWGKGTLEISNHGLKINHCAKGDDKTVQLNPFNTIAVWAAVKFVCRKKPVDQGGKESKMEYTFSPLIADPEAVERESMFQELSDSEEQMILSALNGNDFKNNPLYHQSPMFIVVMRKIGVPRQLECHGFICACSDDAVVIAANLYQVLKINVQNQRSVSNVRSLRCKPENTSRELEALHKIKLTISDKHNSFVNGTLDYNTKKVCNESIEELRNPEMKTKRMDSHVENKTNNCHKVTQTSSEFPIRPPRQNKKLPLQNGQRRKRDFEYCISSEISKNDKQYSSEKQFSSEKPNENVTECAVIKSKNITFKPSMDCSDSFWYRDLSNQKIASSYHGSECGDVLTKIAIPHSRSFLNANGPFTRYFRQQNSGESFSVCNASKEISPLGLNELFTEFRMQEGLNSMDDILDAIIDAEGMSFNDLKPLYKEFLFKLAVTLTKDELYRRSKFIMRRQKKKRKRRNSCCKSNKFSSGSHGLRRVFRQSFSKLRNSKTKLTNLEFTSVLFPSESLDSSLRESHLSTTTGSFSKKSQRNYYLASNMLKSNSTDSDYFRMVPSSERTNQSYMKLTDKMHSNAKNTTRLSSGYMSCSDCSYDSESCTCSSAEKCYCSQKQENEYETQTSSDNKMSPSECACDTDSCFENDKCYCSGSKSQNVTSSYSNVNKPSTVCSSSKFQMYVSHGSSYKNPDCEKLLPPVSAGVEKVCFPDESFGHKIVGGGEWKRYDRKKTTMKKPNEKPICNTCLDYGAEKDSASPCPNFRTYCLCESGITKFQKRMNVYESIHDSRQNFFLTKGHTTGFNGGCEKSGENYELVGNSDTQTDCLTSPERKKVLVVSARDQMGRVIYMGATSRNGNYLRSGDKFVVPEKDSSAFKTCENLRGPSSACEALSVKKSAEIAALFSDVKSGWTTDRYTDYVPPKTKDSKVFCKPEFSSTVFSSRVSYHLSDDLESSLGYFP
ncbi:uncharacterized protein LOC134528822 [Bacillus rossius redtenbacheri]|uniref:uncharacterized protein LOC134528822 n=1 Tax=Bacillus rossius redtenbacheri TaxID=93214 RepID=UPI002FDE10A8